MNANTAPAATTDDLNAKIRATFDRLGVYCIDTAWIYFSLQGGGKQWYDRDVLNALWRMGMIVRVEQLGMPTGRITQTFVDKYWELRGETPPAYCVFNGTPELDPNRKFTLIEAWDYAEKFNAEHPEKPNALVSLWTRRMF